MDLEKYRRLFVEEGTEHLAEMSRALVALEKPGSADEAAEAVDALFRMAHSIKGMAASLDYTSVATLAHHLEDWLEPMRHGQGVATGGLDLLYEALGELEAMVSHVGECGEPGPLPEPLVARLLEPPTITDPLPVPPPDPARRTRPAPTPPPLPNSVRVRTELVDRFLAGVGEIMQRQSRLEALHRQIPFWRDLPEFAEELERMEDSVRELRRRALDMRTTPVRRVLQRVPRIAGELARELGKRVRVELQGEELEVDRAVLDHLDEPLLHVVRNAVDHGIEAPAERARRGKPEVAVIRISAESRGNRVRVRIEDDGCGIDAEAVRRKAVERGLLVEQVAEDLPLEHVCELIFEPGMSTREQVTELSGRGVGMDAVKRCVEGLGGTVGVQTRRGQGTTFELDLPSMVAMQRVLVLEVGHERIALPVASVETVLGVDEGSVEGVGDEAFFVWRDEPIPLLDLKHRIGLPSSRGERRGSVVLLEARGFRLGLRVDRAVEDLEVFVREVPPVLRELKPLAGVAILPDGAPVFLLEVGAFVEEAG